MSRIALGLMRINEMNAIEVESLIRHCLNKGISIFDTADIYGQGKSETILGEVFKKSPELRSRIYLQSKCGISTDSIGYDLSYDNILSRVKASLERLQTSYLDCLFLHRPDIFMDKDEVGRAIKYLLDHQMIKDFAVSNFSTSEIAYLKEALPCEIKFNQVQLGIGNTNMIDQVFNVNLPFSLINKEADDLFFFLKKEGIIIEAWSPFQYGFFEGSIFDNQKYPEINKVLEKYALKYQVSKSAIATSFLLRIEPNLIVVIGSTKKNHIDEALEGETVVLSREDWYRMYSDLGHYLP